MPRNIIRSGATPEGTRNYFDRPTLAQIPHQTLGKTGLTVSAVGFGGYRITDADPSHRNALVLALKSGCNLIDTSTNYTNGHSEKLIGEVLFEMFRNQELKREEVVVITKVGYVQGDNLSVVEHRADNGQGFSDVVKYQPGCWHCISPEFLEDQISRSLARLGLNQIDVLLLHNPEYYLKDDGNHAEYYRRIRLAFEHLEAEAERGRIRYYGISSNSFPDPKESPEYTSLETCLSIAKELPSGGERFAVIQFPFNLYEPGAAFESNNSGKSVVELAALSNLGTLINRPLNAFYRSDMVRLADFPSHEGIDFAESLQEAFTRTVDLETSYSGHEIVPHSKIAWGHILHKNLQRLSDLDTWRQVLHGQIRPELRKAFLMLSRHPEHREWMESYSKASETLFSSFTAYLESGLSNRSQRISEALVKACPKLESSPTLSQKAIRIYRSIPGIHCILVGMRQESYVQDTLQLEAPITPEEALDALEAAHEMAEPHSHPPGHGH